ncbi:MAG TPA: ABC transporter ATP-binding protein [Burkholderiales bacterium]|nr:ABC transporter ATP-binding protein [Burkholderiales bacterium]
MLELRSVCKHFGGVAATDGVSLALPAGEAHALIGPNGAGKTTLLAQICGSLTPDSGDIFFEGRKITRDPQHRRVAAGLARSYQITSIFRRANVLDNLALAVQARSGTSFRFWRPVSAEKRLFEEARALAAEIGLGARLEVAAAALSHGEQRALEVGLALATRPKLLLLDEPMAGMGPEDSQRMVELIARLRGGLTLLLVEHDMDAVFRLADRISVLVNGRLIATDAPQRIKENAEVRKAYLGEEAIA